METRSPLPLRDLHHKALKGLELDAEVGVDQRVEMVNRLALETEGAASVAAAAAVEVSVEDHLMGCLATGKASTLLRNIVMGEQRRFDTLLIQIRPSSGAVFGKP